MTMHPAREKATEALTAQLADTYRVIAYSDNATISQPTVMVALRGFKRDPQTGKNGTVYRLLFVVVVPGVLPGTSDDALDEAAEDVSTAIHVTDLIEWVDSERTTYGGDALPAYQITGNVYIQVTRSPAP